MTRKKARKQQHYKKPARPREIIRFCRDDLPGEFRLTHGLAVEVGNEY